MDRMQQAIQSLRLADCLDVDFIGLAAVLGDQFHSPRIDDLHLRAKLDQHFVHPGCLVARFDGHRQTILHKPLHHPLPCCASCWDRPGPQLLSLSIHQVPIARHTCRIDATIAHDRSS